MIGSIGGPEILFILVLALLLFGPRRLPEIGRTIARTLSEFRRATHDFRANLEREIELDKIKETASTVEQVGAVARKPLSILEESEPTAAPTPRQDTPPVAAEPGSAKPPSDSS